MKDYFNFLLVMAQVNQRYLRLQSLIGVNLEYAAFNASKIYQERSQLNSTECVLEAYNACLLLRTHLILLNFKSLETLNQIFCALVGINSSLG